MYTKLAVGGFCHKARQKRRKTDALPWKPAIWSNRPNPILLKKSDGLRIWRIWTIRTFGKSGKIPFTDRICAVFPTDLVARRGAWTAALPALRRRSNGLPPPTEPMTPDKTARNRRPFRKPQLRDWRAEVLAPRPSADNPADRGSVSKWRAPVSGHGRGRECLHYLGLSIPYATAVPIGWCWWRSVSGHAGAFCCPIRLVSVPARPGIRASRTVDFTDTARIASTGPRAAVPISTRPSASGLPGA